MKKSLFITCAAILLSFAAADKATADGAVYPGNPDKGKTLGYDEGHVIHACETYMKAVYSLLSTIRSDYHPESKEQRIQSGKEKVERAREELIKKVEQYPDEINDTLWIRGFLEYSPLFVAVFSNDVKLVKYMLDKGALPFLPDEAYNMIGEYGVVLSDEVKAVLSQARAKYNVLEIMLKARKAGIKLEGTMPERPFRD